MASYPDVVNDDYGRPIPGVLVYVFNKDGSLATLDSGQANPITTDTFGAFSFSAPDAVYALEYRFAGVTKRLDNVIVGNPPEYVGPRGPKGEGLDDVMAPGGSGLVGFAQDDAGAVARTVAAKSKEIISVTDFGAVADGITDCSPAFRAAQEAARPIGRIRIPRGDLPYVLKSTIDLKSGIIWEADRAVVAAGTDGMTMFDTLFASYFSQFHGLTFASGGKTGVTALRVDRFNATGGLFSCHFQDVDRGIIINQACFGGTIFNCFSERVPRPLQIIKDGSAFNVINANFDNGETVYAPGTGAGRVGTGVGIEILTADPATIGCTITGYVQGFEYGVVDGGVKTRVSAYFETNSEADIFGNGAQHSAYRDCHFLASVGKSAIKLRNTDGVLIDHPIMSSGGRSVGLYDIDTSNTNTVELRPDDASSRNEPLGITFGLSRLSAQISGSYTPVIVGSSSAGTATYSVQLGTFTRTGKSVSHSMTVAWTGHTGTGAILLQGIPAYLAPASFAQARIGAVFATGFAPGGVGRVAKFQGVGTNVVIAVVDAAGVESLLNVPAAGKLEIRFDYDL